MPTRRPFHLEPPGGRALDGFLDVPDRPDLPPYPTVVICHGFKGFMEWGFFPHLAELLAARGFLAVRFNFSGAGVRPGEDRVSDLDAFRDDTYGRELEDLLAVVDGLDEIAGELADRDRLGLFGHSRGGGIALLAAALPERRESVRALVTWAAIAEVDRFDEATKETWRREGVVHVENSRTGQQLPLGRGLLDEVESDREALDLLAAAGRRTAPWRILHGREDASVPYEEAERLAEAAAPPVALHAVDTGDHTFCSRHPFAGPSRELIEAMNETQTWFRRHLAPPEG